MPGLNKHVTMSGTPTEEPMNRLVGCRVRHEVPGLPTAKEMSGPRSATVLLTVEEV